MSDPRRLIDEAGGFEAQLLRAGRKDAISTRSATTIAGALGVTLPAAAATTVAVGAKAATLKSTLAIAGAGAAGALSVWAAVLLFAAPAPLVAPPPRLDARQQAAVAVAPQVEPQASAPAPAVEVAAPRASARVRAPVSSEPDTLPRELEAIDRARSALAGGDASRALALLDEYSARFPKARLRAESVVLRIEALSVRGQKDAAVRLGKEFLAREPNGPYARRVRSLLERAGAPATR